MDEIILKEFDTALDKIEYELNQEDLNLTDGFYSSGEDDDDNDDSSSESVKPDDSASKD